MIEVRNTTDQAQCALHFHCPNLGSIPAFRVVAPIECGTSVQLGRFGLWCGIVLSHWIEPGETLVLAPEPGATNFGQALNPKWVAAASISPRTPDRLPPPPPPAMGWLAAELLRQEVSPDERADRARALEVLSLTQTEGRTPPDIWRAAWMFWHLDRNTHPGLLAEGWHAIAWPDRPKQVEASYRLEIVQSVGMTLAERIDDRLQFGAPRGSINAGSRRAVAYLSALQRIMIDAHYPGCSASRRAIIDCGLGAAFELFAVGKLRMAIARSDPVNTRPVLSEGAPDGVAICMFAEFAFVACELGVDADLWEAILPALVGMLTPYHLAYGERDASGAPIRTPVNRYPSGPREPPRHDVTLHPNPAWHPWIGQGWRDIAPEFVAQLRVMFEGPYRFGGR